MLTNNRYNLLMRQVIRLQFSWPFLHLKEPFDILQIRELVALDSTLESINDPIFVRFKYPTDRTLNRPALWSLDNDGRRTLELQ
jgi:hypothetical protein